MESSLTLSPAFPIYQQILSAQPSKHDRLWTLLTTSFAATILCLGCCINLLIHLSVPHTCTRWSGSNMNQITRLFCSKTSKVIWNPISFQWPETTHHGPCHHLSLIQLSVMASVPVTPHLLARLIPHLLPVSPSLFSWPLVLNIKLSFLFPH